MHPLACNVKLSTKLSIDLALKFYFVSYLVKNLKVKEIKLIQWWFPKEPYVTLNTNGSLLGNLSLAGRRLGGGGGASKKGFYVKIGVKTNNIA